jgi:hypothetical protein
MAMLAATAASGQSMSRQLEEAEAVPLDFLAWIDRDAGWLQEQIAALGGVGQPMITGDLLETTDLDTLKAANRIRAFAHLATHGLRQLYFDLTLSDGDSTKRCVTQFPRSVVPSLGPMDFVTKTFPASAADPAILKMCIATGAGNAEYGGLARDEFRDRYFDATGVLKPEFGAFNDDATFKAKAIDEGFFLSIEGYSGLLRLDPR